MGTQLSPPGLPWTVQASNSRSPVLELPISRALSIRVACCHVAIDALINHSQKTLTQACYITRVVHLESYFEREAHDATQCGRSPSSQHLVLNGEGVDGVPWCRQTHYPSIRVAKLDALHWKKRATMIGIPGLREPMHDPC